MLLFTESALLAQTTILYKTVKFFQLKIALTFRLKVLIIRHSLSPALKM